MKISRIIVKDFQQFKLLDLDLTPIVAAQFRPEERVILDFDQAYHVRAKRGVSPVGDDPNDVLEKDFEVRSIDGAGMIAADGS